MSDEKVATLKEALQSIDAKLEILKSAISEADAVAKKALADLKLLEGGDST